MILYGKRIPYFFIVQLLTTVGVLLVISIISAILDGDLNSYMPDKAFLVVMVTVVICLLAGLPIRLNTQINTWWRRHPFVPLAGIITGLLLLFLSQLSAFKEVTRTYDTVLERNNPYMSITGWFLAAFCSLHIYYFHFVRRPGQGKEMI